MSKYKDILKELELRHPNSNIYVISDQHFFHNNMVKYRGIFSSVEEMNNYIIKKHNEIIKKNDVVIFLGDFSFKKNKIKYLNDLLSGNKYLVLGNHDDSSIIKNYENTGFLGIFLSDVKIDDLILSHYPKNDDFDDLENRKVHKQILLKEFNKKDYINYHGHIHEDSYNSDKYINVSVESINYKPILIKKTKENSESKFINSDDFIKAINLVSNYKSINKNLLIKDYLYTYMLSAIEKYNEDFYLYGSFGLYKKYLLQSNFSDLDIGVIYDEELSKGKNQTKQKNICDLSYEKMNEIFNISNFFYKRSGDLCIYESIFYNKDKTYVETVFDSNLVGVNFFKETDFNLIDISTELEKYIPINSYLKNFDYPVCKIKSTNIEGDVANLLLFYVFGKISNEKRQSIIKKLKYLYYTKKCENIDLNMYEDIIYRFLLRNITFLEKFNRLEEIKYIKSCFENLDEIIKSLPNFTYFETKIFDKNSKLSLINEQLSNNKSINDSVKQLIKF